jgi:hypothetical protein
MKGSTGVARIQDQRQSRIETRQCAGEDLVRECRQANESNVGIGNGRGELRGDQLGPRLAGAESALVPDGPRLEKRLERFTRAVPQPHAMTALAKLRHGSGAARPGTENGDGSHTP